MTVKELYDMIDRIAPFSTQMEGDNSGFLVGSADQEVTAILFALDLTQPVIDEAVSLGAQLIVTHHPLMFSPVQRLTDRVTLRAGNGLEPLDEACGMISVTGMGGRTIRDILLEGKEKLQGASLVLSAHTDLPLIREAVQEIGYHLDREEPCFCAGRYYLVLRARPGRKQLTPREIRLGGPLFSSSSDQLIPYLTRRREVLEAKLRGLLAAEPPDESLINQLREDIAFYNVYI